MFKKDSISFAVLLGVVLLVASAVGAQEANQLKNPSFEAVDAKGMPVDWTLTKNVRPGQTGAPKLIIGPPAHSADKAAQLSFGPALEWAYASQTYWKVLSPGEKYVFSAWFRSDPPARVSLALFAMGERPKPGEKVLSLQKREWIETTEEWKRATVGLTVPEAGQFVRLWCVAQVHTPDVNVSIDDAALVHENPAPSGDVSLHPTHSVGCVRTATAPVLDGKLDDACWPRAGVAESFTNLARAATSKPTQQTKVVLLYDDKNLYVGYRCYESDLDAIKAEKTEQDAKGLWGDDCVELFLVPPDSAFPGIAIVGERYYYLVANSLGTRGDNVGLNKVDQWDGKWQARTAREKDAWTVEMRIPFAELDARPGSGVPWKVNFTRSEKRLGENSTWAPLDQKFHDPQRFANMYFVNDPGDAAVVMAAAVANRAGKITGRWREALSKTAEEIERLIPLVRASSDEGASERARELTQARERITGLLHRLDKTKQEEIVDQEETLNERVETALDRANVLANAADALLRAPKGTSFVVLDAPTITNDRILTTSLVSTRRFAEELALSACPGEYESASFVVATSRDVEGLTVTSSPLTSSKGVVDSSQIDVKLVKCWYQAFGEPWSGGVSFQRGKVLLPELLVYDDDLVRVDLDKRRNLLRVADPKTGDVRYEDVTGENAALTQDLVIRDAESLLPVDIPSGQVRQFWVTVHVPDDAAPGAYEGALTVRCNGSSEVKLPIRLTVHPFKLAKSAVDQSIYYRGQLSGSDVPVIDRGNKKTETQYAAELRDMVAHGVTSPLVYQAPGGPGDMDLVRRALEIRQEAGVDTDRFFFCAWGVVPKDVNEGTRRVLGGLKELAGEFGYREFYNYGPDEPSVERVREQIAPWKFVHELGWKVYLACNVLADSTGKIRPDLWNEIRGSVDLFVIGGPPNEALARTLREAGCEVYNYANPQCGIEEPLTYRRHYGLLLWKAGYDGAMDYAYQHGFGDHMWNDFDGADLKNPYRDHVMAYATSDGVVDTIQWEGYREGVDDLRYLSTLLLAIEKAKKNPAHAKKAREAQAWLDAIDPAGDLDEIRAGMVARIGQLQ